LITLDTNILVRFLVQDDPEQASRARAVLLNALADGSFCFVSDVVLCELVWVLRRGYDFRPEDIQHALRQLFLARQLTFSSPEQLQKALAAYEEGWGDFADYLIREHGRGIGSTHMVTFDKDLLKEPGFVAP